ncbi:MAG: hypothetical protein ACI9JN_002136 [Bacteroidia bacterium]|jgi:hypothetical protein
MKKTLFTTVFLLATVFSFAQKPEQGNVVTEAQFNFGNNATTNFGLSALKFRYFIAADMVARLSLNLTGTSSTDNFAAMPDGSGATGSYDWKTSGFGAAVGVEKHYTGNSNFSPYMGVQVGFGSGKTTNEGTNSDGFTYVMDYSESSEAKISTFGANVFVGGDYWIGKSFYVGTELGFGFTSRTRPESTMTTTTAGTTATQVTPESTGMSFGQFVMPAFRIGFVIM